MNFSLKRTELNVRTNGIKFVSFSGDVLIFLQTTYLSVLRVNGNFIQLYCKTKTTLDK